MIYTCFHLALILSFYPCQRQKPRVPLLPWRTEIGTRMHWNLPRNVAPLRLSPKAPPRGRQCSMATADIRYPELSPVVNFVHIDWAIYMSSHY